jgi:flagellar basal body-associated protein FliL
MTNRKANRKAYGGQVLIIMIIIVAPVVVVAIAVFFFILSFFFLCNKIPEKTHNIFDLLRLRGQ